MKNQQTTNNNEAVLENLQTIWNKVNNDEMGPVFYNFLENNVPKDYDEGGEFWNPMINLSEYIASDENNVFGITDETEYQFFMNCIFNDDFEAFLNEYNETSSTIKDWEEWVNKVITIIQK